MGYYKSSQIAMQYEVGTYGTPQSGDALWVGLIQSHDPSEEISIIEEDYVGNTDRSIADMYKGVEDYSGSITYHPQNWRLLAFALGSIVDGEEAEAPYTHTLQPASKNTTYAAITSDLQSFPSFSLQDVKVGETDNNLIRTFNGCIVDSFAINITNGEPISCEVGYNGKQVVPSQLDADIWNISDKSTIRPYLFSDFSLTLGGSPVDELVEASLSMNNNLTSKHYLNGSNKATIQKLGKWESELTLTLDATSEWGKTLYEDYYLAGAKFNCDFNLVKDAGNDEVKIALSDCVITDMKVPTPLEGDYSFSLTIKPTTVTATVKDAIDVYNVA